MDPYQNPDAQAEAVTGAMIQRLEERGDHPIFNGYIDTYLERVDVSGLSRVLDLGCGTGVVTRRLETMCSPETQIVGADVSETFIDAARERSGPNIEWDVIVGDAPLPYADGSMDLVVLHTVLSHVPDPAETLRECARVLAAGGQIVVFDADYASTTFALDDFAKGREIDHKLFSAVVHNLDVCRRMPQHLAAAGLRLDDHSGHLISEAGKGDYWLSSVRGFAKLIGPLNILPEAEGKAWVEAMLNHHEAGTFFAFGTYYTFFASKP